MVFGWLVVDLLAFFFSSVLCPVKFGVVGLARLPLQARSVERRIPIMWPAPVVVWLPTTHIGWAGLGFMAFTYNLYPATNERPPRVDPTIWNRFKRAWFDSSSFIFPSSSAPTQPGQNSFPHLMMQLFKWLLIGSVVCSSVIWVEKWLEPGSRTIISKTICYSVNRLAYKSRRRFYWAGRPWSASDAPKTTAMTFQWKHKFEPIDCQGKKNTRIQP